MELHLERASCADQDVRLRVRDCPHGVRNTCEETPGYSRDKLFTCKLME